MYTKPQPMNMETIGNSECNARPENRTGSQLCEGEEVGLWSV
jgi:hypothetical protein